MIEVLQSSIHAKLRQVAADMREHLQSR